MSWESFSKLPAEAKTVALAYEIKRKLQFPAYYDLPQMRGDAGIATTLLSWLEDAINREQGERLKWKNLALQLASDAREVLSNAHWEVTHASGDLIRTLEAVKVAQWADMDINPQRCGHPCDDYLEGLNCPCNPAKP